MQRQGRHKLLSDQRLLQPFSEAEQALIVDYWQTRSVRQGLVIRAVVLSQDVFARLSFSRIRHEAQGVLHYRLFDEEAAAATWLGQQP